MIRQSLRMSGLIAMLMLLAGGFDAAHGDALLTALPDRPIDSRVSEPDTIAQLQQRLDAVAPGSAAACEASYQVNKAQAWINFAKYAYHEKAPSRVLRAATEDADELVTDLESGAASSNETHELPTSRHQRNDLWQAVSIAKSDGRLCGAPKMLAYCEVQLAWVDYESAVGGWRHVDPYIRIAEDYCTAALHAKPVAAPAPEVVIPVPPVSPNPPGAPANSPAVAKSHTAPYIDAAAVVLFPHNRARRADMRAPSKADLKQLVAQIKSLPAHTPINIVGHADITGNRRYNEALSARRANSVAAQLQRLGIDRARMHVSSVGSDDPIVQCESPRSPADRRRYLNCLEPNRAVVIRLREP